MAKYLKRDSEKGFVEDYVEIQSLKFNNIRHTVLGGMLGDYDDNGYYRVHPDIVKELIEMPKYVVEVMDNLEICLSTFKLDKQISFLVAFEGEKATLSLIEKVSYEGNNKLDGGTWSNVNEFVLDVVETNGEIDRQALYIKWNIQTFPGEIVDIFNCEDSVLAKYFNIVTRFKYNLEAKTMLLKKEEELEEIEAEYFLDLFEILKGYPQLKIAVEKQIKQTLTEKKDFLKLDKPNFTKTLNELVEKEIDENIAVLSENQQALFKIEKRNIMVKSNIKKYDTISVVSEKLENLNEEKEIEGIQELDLNDTPVVCSKTILNKLQTENVEYESFNSITNKYVKVETKVNENLKKDAISILLGTSKSKKGKVVDIVIKTGIKTEIILSSQDIMSAVSKNVAESTVNKKVEEKKTTAEKVVLAEKKPQQKNSSSVKKKTNEIKKEEKKEVARQQDKKSSKTLAHFINKTQQKQAQQSANENNKVLEVEKNLQDKSQKGLVSQLAEKAIEEVKETAMEFSEIAKVIERRKIDKTIENRVGINDKIENRVTKESSLLENVEKIEKIEDSVFSQ